MIDSTGHRGGYADRRSAWARICDDFRKIEDRAARYRLDRRLAKLVDRTRNGDQRFVEWQALLGELAELSDDEEFMTWRNSDRRAARVWPSAVDPTGTGFACPGDLCSRRSAPSLTERPQCALLHQEMTDLGSGSARRE